MIFYWGRWAGVLVACIATTLVALEMPVRLSEESAGTARSDLLSEVVVDVAAEDLADFMANRRWGISLNEILAAQADRPEPPEPDDPPEPDERTINPVLAKMGYVGLIVAKDRSAVLLASPEGGITRLTLGSTLPDGRALVSVTDDGIVLGGDGQPEEVLTLFPRVRPTGADESGASGGENGTSVPAPDSTSR